MKRRLDVSAGAPTHAKLFQAGISLREAVSTATQVLSDAGVAGAAGDARLLVSAATQRRTVDLIAHPDAQLDDVAAGGLNVMVARRTRCEPVSRILGEREFYGRAFEITPATLDPRPDSETIIEAALEVLNSAPIEEGTPLNIIDIGTGSGCLIVTLLAEFPAATGVATDICPEALTVAQRNAQRHGVADRLHLRQCDLLEEVDGCYNLLVSNPPYIPSNEIAGLDPDVAGFDPHKALDGGIDGLDPYRRMAPKLKSLMERARAPSWAVFEVGAGQAKDVAEILINSGHTKPRTWSDLGGHTRGVAVETLC